MKKKTEMEKFRQWVELHQKGDAVPEALAYALLEIDERLKKLETKSK